MSVPQSLTNPAFGSGEVEARYGVRYEPTPERLREELISRRAAQQKRSREYWDKWRAERAARKGATQ